MIVHGDCLEVMTAMPEASVDAIVTDPPYGLEFMGRGWDHGVPGVDYWREALRVLKPGGHLLAFGGTRTYHRLACAVEDAGFEIRDQIAWVYGQGFPKSLDVSKAIDKAAGAERDVVGYDASRARPNRLYEAGAIGNIGGTGRVSDRTDNGATITAPATDAARQWSGWGTALKPAVEPIVVARKPLIGTVAANVLEHGTGALNIDGCRVPFQGDADKASAFPGGKTTSHGTGSLAGPGAAQDVSRSEFEAVRNEIGRWPANLIHDGSEEVLSCFPELAGGGDMRGKQDGRRPGGFGDVGAARGDGRPNATVYADTGSAARFFYCAKASKRERGEGNTHPTVKPVTLMRYLVRLVTPPGGVVLDPFMGSGTTGVAAEHEGVRFIGIEQGAEYVEIARTRLKATPPQRRLF